MHSEREIPIRLRVNGRERDVDVDPRASLLDVLRERLGLTGTMWNNVIVGLLVLLVAVGGISRPLPLSPMP